jgi:hypothetical protein
MARAQDFNGVETVYADLADVPGGSELHLVTPDEVDLNVTITQLAEIIGAEASPIQDGEDAALAIDDYLGSQEWRAGATGGSITLLDEDNFASDSAIAAPSQQSTKAYIGSQITALALPLTYFIDEDSFASNSETKVPSQQSVKAYVDAADVLKLNASVVIDEDNLSSNSAVHVPTQRSVKTYVDAAVSAIEIDEEELEAALLAVLGELDPVEGAALITALGGLVVSDLVPLSTATAGEINTGTDTAKYITPDALAGSNIGTKELGIIVFKSNVSCSTGDGLDGMPVPASMAGMNVIDVVATTFTKGITGAMNIQLRRRRNGASVDVLSTPVTVGDEWFVSDGVVNASNDDLAEGDMLYVDVDQVHSGTPALGLSVAVTAQLP